MIKLRHRYLIASLLMAVVLVLLLALVAAPVLAGLRVSGAILVTDVSPGETITHQMGVSIRDSDAAMDMLVDVKGLGEYSAKDFIAVDKTSFHLEPGGSQDLVVTIRVPQDVSAGGRYAIVYVHSVPTGEGQVGTAVAVNVPIYLTIKGSQLIHTGKITELIIGKAVSGQPVDIFTTLENTGNHHFKVKGEVAVSDASGETLDTIDISLTSSSIVPTLSAQLKATYIPQGELPLGVYSIRSTVMLEDGTLLDEAEGSFEVKEPYVPPLPPATLTLTPGSAGVLKTADGRISISFPAGAVISQVEVSLENYPLEQLRSPPADFSLATTCFRVDGLSGLLAKEATVTVKYTQADLSKAEGDASRLRLARWDQAQNQWSVLETKVDTGATTLSTDTNQLSIWAVMVGSPQQGVTAPAPPAEVNWPLIGGIVAGVIIIGLLVYFLIMRRRRGY